MEFAMQDAKPTLVLTNRETEVLVHVIEGRSAKQIAILMGIAPRTVECHIDHMRTKTNSRNKAQMAVVALRAGFFPQV